MLGQAVKLRSIHPDLRIQVSRPIGPEVTLLTVLDQRLRSSLGAHRVLELDGLVLSSARTGDVRGNALLGATPELLDVGVPDDAFKPLTGDDKAPVLAVGDKLIAKGYSESRWQALLDEAGS